MIDTKAENSKQRVLLGGFILPAQLERDAWRCQRKSSGERCGWAFGQKPEMWLNVGLKSGPRVP